MTLENPSSDTYYMLLITPESCVFFHGLSQFRSVQPATFLAGGSRGSRGRLRCWRHAAVSEGGLPGRQARCGFRLIMG